MRQRNDNLIISRRIESSENNFLSLQWLLLYTLAFFSSTFFLQPRISFSLHSKKKLFIRDAGNCNNVNRRRLCFRLFFSFSVSLIYRRELFKTPGWQKCSRPRNNPTCEICISERECGDRPRERERKSRGSGVKKHSGRRRWCSRLRRASERKKNWAKKFSRKRETAAPVKCLTGGFDSLDDASARSRSTPCALLYCLRDRWSKNNKRKRESEMYTYSADIYRVITFPSACMIHKKLIKKTHTRNTVL